MTTTREKEQQQLVTVYHELQEEQKRLRALITEKDQHGRQHIEEMTGDIRLNMETITDNLDTFANIEALNRQIDQYNIQLDSARGKLEKVERLLVSPYFGKVTVDFLDEEPLEDFYIGINGFTTESGLDLIYDWRSPIAELFYNNELGASRYQTIRQQIEVVIEKRRQLITEKNRLINYFDTDTAIQDDVLLDVLSENATSGMRDITATIQKEQNQIIRDLRSAHVLVNGVAGSGKTSTIMQRIAYILYRNRQQYSAEEMLIFSPNKAFAHYISDVLPSLGEKNPATMTLLQLAQHFLAADLETETAYFQRISCPKATDQELVLRSSAFASFILTTDSPLSVVFADIVYKKRILLTKEHIAELFAATPAHYALVDRIAATKAKLKQEWERHLIQQAKSAELRDQVLNLTEAQQQKYFGKLLTERSEAHLTEYAEILLRKKYRGISRQIRQLNWLDSQPLLPQLYEAYTGKSYQATASISLDEAIMTLLIRHTLVEKLALPIYKVILIDEIQDYTPAQLFMIRRFWPQAELTMVGDENQAIFNSRISFAEIKAQVTDAAYYRLSTSYRSSGAITELFGSLLENSKDINVTPIRPVGAAVTFAPYANAAAFFQQILPELTPEKQYMILAKNWEQAEQLRFQTKGQLPKNMRITSIELAKGLEFDHVILYAVSAENYHTDQDRRLLYTGISRAMQSLLITYEAHLTPFLKRI